MASSSTKQGKGVETEICPTFLVLNSPLSKNMGPQEDKPKYGKRLQTYTALQK
jgi:hypothetical protein